jgi:hypothetical protein
LPLGERPVKHAWCSTRTSPERCSATMSDTSTQRSASTIATIVTVATTVWNVSRRSGLASPRSGGMNRWTKERLEREHDLTNIPGMERDWPARQRRAGAIPLSPIQCDVLQPQRCFVPPTITMTPREPLPVPSMEKPTQRYAIHQGAGCLPVSKAYRSLRAMSVSVALVTMAMAQPNANGLSLQQDWTHWGEAPSQCPVVTRGRDTRMQEHNTQAPAAAPATRRATPRPRAQHVGGTGGTSGGPDVGLHLPPLHAPRHRASRCFTPHRHPSPHPHHPTARREPFRALLRAVFEAPARLHHLLAPDGLEQDGVHRRVGVRV